VVCSQRGRLRCVVFQGILLRGPIRKEPGEVRCGRSEKWENAIIPPNELICGPNVVALSILTLLILRSSHRQCAAG